MKLNPRPWLSGRGLPTGEGTWLYCVLDSSLDMGDAVAGGSMKPYKGEVGCIGVVSAME